MRVSEKSEKIGLDMSQHDERYGIETNRELAEYFDHGVDTKSWLFIRRFRQTFSSFGLKSGYLSRKPLFCFLVTLLDKNRMKDKI